MSRIGVTGCALIDYLYGSVNFASQAFQRYRSKRPGDGGLRPGGLVFASDLEQYAGRPLSEILTEIVGSVEPDAANVGGPAVVAAVHAAQVGVRHGVDVSFYGARGDDAGGHTLLTELSETPLDIEHYAIRTGATASTVVLSDPSFAGGAGERCFINTVGASDRLSPEDLPDSFYNADVVLFGGTALVPALHDRLDECLITAHKTGALTVVGTVYDFRNEQRSPSERWPLCRSSEGWKSIDVLIADYEEALRISGTDSADSAVDAFLEMGVGAAVVTRGTDDLIAESAGAGVPASGRVRLPVSQRVLREHRAGYNPFGVNVGDTTGCGDNFVGGVVYALSRAKERGTPADIDFRFILAHGVVAGGLATFHLGGMRRENRFGERADIVSEYLADYCRRIGIDELGGDAN